MALFDVEVLRGRLIESQAALIRHREQYATQFAPEGEKQRAELDEWQIASIARCIEYRRMIDNYGSEEPAEIRPEGIVEEQVLRDTNVNVRSFMANEARPVEVVLGPNSIMGEHALYYFYRGVRGALVSIEGLVAPNRDVVLVRNEDVPVLQDPIDYLHNMVVPSRRCGIGDFSFRGAPVNLRGLDNATIASSLNQMVANYLKDFVGLDRGSYLPYDSGTFNKVYDFSHPGWWYVYSNKLNIGTLTFA